MDINPLPAIAYFFEAYENKSAEILSTKLNQEKSVISSFFKDFDEELVVYKKEIKKYAPEYNIFSILNIGHLEAKVHSPFLQNLLDPNGSHAQGSFFVKKFFELLNLFQKVNINYDRLEVITESYTGDGFIDIVIRYRNRNFPFIVIIENKIYAGDQEKQLERYYNYANNQLNLHDHQIKLLYLKPHLEDPTAWSLDTKKLKDWKKNKLLEIISYDNQIQKWLSDCLSEIHPEGVKQSLKQYIKIIKTL